MDWELTIFVVVAIIGYIHLLKKTQERYVTAIVRLHLESREKGSNDIPLKLEQFDKFCRFVVTPTPGMEFVASDIEGARIKRVVIDELGALEVICLLTITDVENEFETTCKHLSEQGWLKKSYV